MIVWPELFELTGDGLHRGRGSPGAAWPGSTLNGNFVDIATRQRAGRAADIVGHLHRRRFVQVAVDVAGGGVEHDAPHR